MTTMIITRRFVWITLAILVTVMLANIIDIAAIDSNYLTGFEVGLVSGLAGTFFIMGQWIFAILTTLL